MTIDGAALAKSAERIVFTVPLPYPALRANSRSHWATRKKAADAYSMDVMNGYWSAEFHPHDHTSIPWDAALVTYTWRYAGAQPDHSNLGGNTKYLQDILCVAPRFAPGKYKRWHMGIVVNDREIEAVFKLEKVAHKADECVLVEIEKR